MQIHLACPQTLLPVLPLLSQELQAEEETRRLEAIDLLAKLFKLPGSDMDQHYSYLFEEFVRRSKDQKVIKLVASLNCSHSLHQAHHSHLAPAKCDAQPENASNKTI